MVREQQRFKVCEVVLEKGRKVTGGSVRRKAGKEEKAELLEK